MTCMSRIVKIRLLGYISLEDLSSVAGHELGTMEGDAGQLSSGKSPDHSSKSKEHCNYLIIICIYIYDNIYIYDYTMHIYMIIHIYI